MATPIHCYQALVHGQLVTVRVFESGYRPDDTRYARPINLPRAAIDLGATEEPREKRKPILLTPEQRRARIIRRGPTPPPLD